MTPRRGPTWLARGAWLALLVLLVVQAALGVRDVVVRAAAVPLAERVACLGPDVAWRYRALLGQAYPALTVLHDHGGPDTVIVVVHDDSPAGLLLAAEFTGILFPRAVRPLPQPPAQTRLPVVAAGDVLTLLLDGDAAASDLLQRGGWHLRASGPRWQVWDSLATRPAAAPDAALAERRVPPFIDPETTPRMSNGRLALLVALPLLAGALLLFGLRLRPRDEPLAFWGWAWMAGCVWIGLLQLAWLLAGGSVWALGPLSWSLAALSGPVALAAWAVRTARRGAPAAVRARPVAQSTAAAADTRERGEPRGTRSERLLFAGCVVFALAHVADHLVLSGARVVSCGDEGTIWGAKAKALWAADGFNEDYDRLVRQPDGIWHQDYPTLNPLLQVFAGQLAGRPLDFENRVPVLLFLPALVLALAGALRQCTRPAVAGLLLVVFISCRTSTEALKAMHSDVLLACGLLLLLEALRHWRLRASRGGESAWGWLALAGLGATLLVFGKNEGQLLLLAAGLAGVVGWGLGGRPRVRLRLVHALWLLPALAVWLAHVTLNRRSGFVNDLLETVDGRGLVARIVAQGTAQAGEVFSLLGEYLLTAERETRLLVAAFLVLLLLCPRRLLAPRRDDAHATDREIVAWPDRSLGSRCVLFALAGFLLIFLGTPHDVSWHVRWSLPRLMFQLLPLVVLALGAAATGLAVASRRRDRIEPGNGHAPRLPDAHGSS